MSIIQKFIVENPYRLIGILSNSKIGEIKRNINKIKAFNKIGKDLKIEFDVEGISFPNFKLKDYPIDKIENSINSPIDKIKYSLFWFSDINPGDAMGLKLLNDNKISECIELWSKIVKVKKVTKSNYSTFNNLSSLLLIKNIDKNKNIFFNQESSNIEIKESINIKFKFLSSNFLTNYSESISSSSKSLTPKEMIDYYSDSIQKILETTFKQNEINSILNDLDDSVINKIHGDKTNVLIRIINNEIKKAADDRKKNTDGFNIGNNLMINTKNQIIELKNILGKSNLQYKNYADKLARELESCGQLYLSQSGSDYSYISIYNFALLISEDLKLKTQIKNTIKSSKDLKKSEGAKEILIATKDYGELKNRTLNSAKSYLDTCEPYLNKMKVSLGNKNELYITLSSKVANIVIDTSIEVSNKQNQIQNSEIQSYNISASAGVYRSSYKLETVLKKTVRDLEKVNRLVKRLELMDLNNEVKSFLDRNKKVLNTNLKQARQMLRQLSTTSSPYNYSSPSYSSPSYSSNYSSGVDLSGCLGPIIGWGILFFILSLMDACN